MSWFHFWRCHELQHLALDDLSLAVGATTLLFMHGLFRRHSVSVLVAASSLALLAGPVERAAAQEDPPARAMVTHFFAGGEGKITGVQTVVGATRVYRVRSEETFLDIARKLDVGYNEMVGANPGVDPWIPDTGHEVLVPTEWVLPRGPKEGLVLNIPEMRLYYYVPSPRTGGKSSMVVTYPVALGRRDWQTPRGEFHVRGKTKNPAWVIPESIKAERIADSGWSADVIPGGHPDNPLGKYRLELTLPSYAIHGSNKEWGVGMQVSHGCVRMYPEDIEAFFPVVQIGTPGVFTYQPIKLGVRNGRVVAEVHEDIYGVMPWMWRAAKELVDEMGLRRYVDFDKLEAVVAAQSGVPTDVGYVGWPKPEVSRPIRFDSAGNPVSKYPDASVSR